MSDLDDDESISCHLVWNSHEGSAVQRVERSL
jgi:hypothetical protein